MPQEPLNPKTVTGSETAAHHSVSASHHDDAGAALTSSKALLEGRWLSLLINLTTILALGLLVWAAMRLLGAIHHTVLLFALGALLAYALDPVVDWVCKIGTPTPRSHGLGVATVFGGIALIILVALLLFSHKASHQVEILVADHQRIEDRSRFELARLDDWLEQHGLHLSLSSYLDSSDQKAKGLGEAVAKQVIDVAKAVGKAAGESAVVVLISLYFLTCSDDLKRSTKDALPQTWQPYADQWQRDVNRVLGGFVRGQAILAIVMGSLAAAVCFLLNIKIWLLIGIFVMFVSLIPVFGPYIGAIPASIAAAIAHGGLIHSPGLRVLAVLLMFVVINEVGSKILYPRLVGKALGLHEITVLFVLFAGLEVGGITGVLFAAPVTALCAVTATQLYRLWQGLPPTRSEEQQKAAA